MTTLVSALHKAWPLLRRGHLRRSLDPVVPVLYLQCIPYIGARNTVYRDFPQGFETRGPSLLRD